MGMINSIGAFVAAQLAARIIPQTAARTPSIGAELSDPAAVPPPPPVPAPPRDLATENDALRKQLAQQAVEILALKQQLAIYRRKQPRPRLRPRDRVFWTVLSALWTGWPAALIVVKPDTVIGWHRKGFKLWID